MRKKALTRQLIRILEIYALSNTKSGVCLKQIQNKHRVSFRTIERDINALSQAGVNFTSNRDGIYHGTFDIID